MINKKLSVSFVLIFFILLLVYQIAIKVTLANWNKLNELSEQAKSYEDLNLLETEYNNCLINIENNVDSHYDNITDLQQIMLNEISVYDRSKSIFITEIAKPHEYLDGDYIINTEKISLEGNFHDILQVVYETEKKRKIGKIASIYFLMKENKINNEKKLTMQFYIQNILKVNSLQE